MKRELVLHCGSEKVSREELKEVKVPKGTDTWIPVSHYEAVNLIAEEAKKRDMKILREEYGINSTGSRLFGVMRFQKGDNPEWTRALGIRNSNDRTLSLGMVAGVNVFCCDNLSFCGEVSVMRRHTKGINIESLIPEAFEKLNHKFIRLENDIDKLKIEMVSVDEARVITCMSAELGYIRPSDVVPIVKEFQNPIHEEFKELSKWHLYNAFTEHAKRYSPFKAEKCYRGLAKIFNLLGE